MQHFRMILDRIQLPLRILIRCARTVRGMSCNLKSRRRLCDIIVMAHPTDHRAGDSVIKSGKWFVDDDLRLPILTFISTCNLPAKHIVHQLSAITQAKNRYTQLEELLRSGCRPFLIDTVRSACQDNSLRIHLPDLIQRRSVRVDLAVHVALAHTPGYKLVVLPAKVDDNDFLLIVLLHPCPFYLLDYSCCHCACRKSALLVKSGGIRSCT